MSPSGLCSIVMDYPRCLLVSVSAAPCYPTTRHTASAMALLARVNTSASSSPFCQTLRSLYNSIFSIPILDNLMPYNLQHPPPRRSQHVGREPCERVAGMQQQS